MHAETAGELGILCASGRRMLCQVLSNDMMVSGLHTSSTRPSWLLHCVRYNLGVHVVRQLG